jgi:hypothetical protein
MMPIRTSLLLVVFVLAGYFALPTSSLEVGAPDYGSADKPSRSLPMWLNERLQSGAEKIVIPPGRYYVKPDRRVHLRFEGLKDVEIVAIGVELICTQTTRAVDIEDCQGLTIRGLMVDYDPLPFTQGRIIEISDDKRTQVIELFEGYPSASKARSDKYEIYDEEDQELKTRTYFDVSVQAIDERRLRITKPGNASRRTALEELGDLAVFDSDDAKDGSLPHAIQASGCRDLTLDRVTLFGSNSFGFFETNCQNSQYIRCIVDRRPLKEDLVSRGYGRLRSLNADAFHSKYGNAPQYKKCVAKYMGDDAFAINGDYHLVSFSTGDTLRVIAKRGRNPNIEVGDSVQLVDEKGERLPNAKVLSIRRSGAPTDTEKQFITDSRLIDQTKRRILRSRGTYLIELDREIDLSIGSVIAADSRVGNGFKIIGCEVGPTRSRGILVKASDGLISGNTIRGTWGEAIKVAPEWQWLEAGHSSNVVIQSNRISGIRSVGIAVYAEAADGELAAPGAHRDITIRNNKITDAPSPAIVVTSTLGLVEQNNTVSINPSIDLHWSGRLMRELTDHEADVYIVSPRP